MSKAVAFRLIILIGFLYLQYLPASSAVAAPNNKLIHKVKEGDCLWKLSRRYKISEVEIIRANKLKPNAILHIGQLLVIPKMIKHKAEDKSTKQLPGDKPDKKLTASLQNGVAKNLLEETAEKAKEEVPPDAAATASQNLITREAIKQTEGRAPSPPANRGFGQRLVATALKFKGIRYRRGGSLPSRGFDCSGLVLRVLALNNIKAPHSASGISKMGKPVNKSELAAGDLVFFRTVSKHISHVGIYIGSGKFIHAASRGNARVRIDSLSKGYYSKRFVAARRLLR